MKQTVENITLINAYAKAFLDDFAVPMDTTCIGKKVVLNFGSTDDYFSFVLLDDLVKDFNDNIDRINNVFAKSEPIEKAG